MTLTAILLNFTALNASAAMEPKLESTLIEVCKTGLSDNTFRFNKTMRDNRINKAIIFPNLICNGESFYNFALSNGANKIASRIKPYAKTNTSITDLASNYKLSVKF